MLVTAHFRRSGQLKLLLSARLHAPWKGRLRLQGFHLSRYCFLRSNNTLLFGAARCFRASNVIVIAGYSLGIGCAHNTRARLAAQSSYISGVSITGARRPIREAFAIDGPGLYLSLLNLITFQGN